MKISFNLLKKFVDFDLTPDQTAHMLTFMGVETSVISSGYNWTNVFTAKVLSKTKHPNADKLSLCEVNDGTQTYSIVCGAPNVVEGQIVALAKIGAVLPGDFEIKQSKIRGVDSEGMLCSESELGLTDKSNGIMVLGADTALGKPLETILGESDAILEVEITPNRGDCLSHLGIVREIGAKLKKTITLPMVRTTSNVSVINNIKIESPLCSRYIGFIIENVKVGPSPKWLANDLAKFGIRSINNIVDVTNYVMLELGQPLHAFDTARLSSDRIIIRNAKEGEKILALDGKEYKLDSQMLVVADANRPVAIAGVMGGEESGINENTQTVFLESAAFDSSSVRRTSKLLKLTSDSSYRFERGTDWELTELASWRAANLIATVSGGHLLKREDVKKIKFKKTEILLRLERVTRVLGYTIDGNSIAHILRSLGIDLQPRKEVILCTIPSWRNDIKDEIDVIEEIARIYGYENIPKAEGQSFKKFTENNSFLPKIVEDFRYRLYGLGFCEALNYSFSEIKDLNTFGLKYAHKILNPISKENEVLRPSLLPGLYKNLVTNLGYDVESIALFEYGKVFIEEGERKNFAAIMYGDVWGEWWKWEENKINPKFDFHFVGGIIQSILPRKEFTISENLKTKEFFHPGKTAAIVYRGKAIGQFGVLKPSISQDLKQEVLYFEIDLENYEEAQKKTELFKSFSKFPAVKRDLSIIVDKSLEFSKIENTIKNIMKTGNILKEYVLFSVYENLKKVGKGKISYSLRLTYKTPERTLTDEEVNKDFNDLIEKLGKEFGAKLRT